MARGALLSAERVIDPLNLLVNTCVGKSSDDRIILSVYLKTLLYTAGSFMSLILSRKRRTD